MEFSTVSSVINSNISDEWQAPLRTFLPAQLLLQKLSPPYFSFCDTVPAHSDKSCDSVTNAEVARQLISISGKERQHWRWCPFHVCLFSGHFKGLTATHGNCKMRNGNEILSWLWNRSANGHCFFLMLHENVCCILLCAEHEFQIRSYVKGWWMLYISRSTFRDGAPASLK